MALAEELLDNISEEQVAEYALSELKPHIVIDEDRNIILPERYKTIAAQGDHDVTTYTFDCPRFSDGRDMSKMVVYINYIRSDGKTGSYPADNVIVDGQNQNLMHFEWTPRFPATIKHGIFAFLICVCSTETNGNMKNHWSTRLCKDAYISEGMDCHQDNIVDVYPDVITRILERLNMLEDGVDVFSWNDLTDKPFGEITNEIKVLEEQTLALSLESVISSNNYKYLALIEIPITKIFVVGDTVNVLWDGMSYSCVATEIGGDAHIGNLSLYEGEEDTGEPFLIVCMDDGVLAVFGLIVENATVKQKDFTVGITKIESTVVQINEKYIPDRFASKETVNKLSEEIADLKENGTGSGLTAEMATALDNMFKVCAYTKEDVSEEYNAFRTAFGLDVVLIPATAITLTSSALSFTALNDSRTLKATLEPTNSTDKVTWTSSNEAVAKVVNGVVTVVGEGTATITATATSGVKATCSVNVVLASKVYTVTNTLENVTNSNNATTVEEGSNYIAYLTVAEGYELTAPKITMGGVDITATAYANGTISINSVTGNIVIEAIATEINTVIYELAEPLVCDGVNYVDTGVVVCGTGNLYSKDFTLVTDVDVDIISLYAINGDGTIPDNRYIYDIANTKRFSLNQHTSHKIRTWISNTGETVELDIGTGFAYNDLKNDGFKMAITHVAGKNAIKVFVITENTKNFNSFDLMGAYGSISHNIPYSLVLGAYYDADTNGNVVPSNFRGTINHFAIHEGIWTDETINEFLGVE